MKPKRTFDGDDGETIVNMDVDGMPWYDRRGGIFGSRKSTSNTDGAWTPEEERAYKWAALKASLLVVAVFAIVFGIFIAFLDFVVFR